MLKKIFILILLFFLTSCGYEAIHSNKKFLNYNFSISQLTFFGNRVANLKIKEKLNNYTLNKKNKNYALKISSDVEKISWPSISKEDLVEEEINFVVQINGKKRAILKVNRDIDENSILDKIKLNVGTEKLLHNQKIKKTIFVSNRLINIIL